MAQPAIKKASINSRFINRAVELPYGLKVDEIMAGIQDTYDLLHRLNQHLIEGGSERLEDLLLGNSLSGLISELLVKKISNNSRTLIRNVKVGGHPDLIPRGKYPDDSVLRASDGVEIKSSIQDGGWQGHNPEAIWLVVFRYVFDADRNKPTNERSPITFVQVLAAKMTKEDWSFSGRKGKSRRTITASITRQGTDKLRRNPVYQDPAYVVATNQRLRTTYLAIPHR